MSCEHAECVLAKRYIELQLWGAAKGILAQCHHLYPNCVSTYRLSAELALHAEDYPSAVEQLDRALIYAPSDDLKLDLAEALFLNNQFDESETLLSSIKNDYSKVQARLCLRKAALFVQDGKQAKAEYSVIETLKYVNDLNVKDRKELASLLVQLHDKSAIVDILASAKGALAYVKGLFLEAIDEDPVLVEAAFRAAGKDPAARLALAIHLAPRRSHDQCIRDEVLALLTALDAFEGDFSADLLLASFLDDELDDYATIEKTIAAYTSAIRKMPRSATAYNNLGVIALRQGQIEAAERSFIQALVVDEGHLMAQRNLARVIHARGSSRQVEKTIERMLEHGVSFHVVSDLLFATIEIAREDVQHGVAEKGHKLKNLLGVLGSRLRSVRKRSVGEVRTKVDRVYEEFSNVYDEWASYLRTLREDPAFEFKKRIVWLDRIDINRMIKDAVNVVDYPVSFELNAMLPDVRGKRGLLIEAIVNVLRNAVEADPKTTIHITSALIQNGKWVQLILEDSGPGIATQDLRLVRQAGFTTKKDGNGLGLSFCERVVEAHGGRLQLSSKANRGTRVEIHLPVQLDSQARYRLLQTPFARILDRAKAEEYVDEA